MPFHAWYWGRVFRGAVPRDSVQVVGCGCGANTATVIQSGQARAECTTSQPPDGLQRTRTRTLQRADQDQEFRVCSFAFRPRLRLLCAASAACTESLPERAHALFALSVTTAHLEQPMFSDVFILCAMPPRLTP
eukprot:1588927-Rhodomonas_salina.2